MNLDWLCAFQGFFFVVDTLLRLKATNESISPLSGSINLYSTDVVMPGINGMDFSLSRVYNSDDAQKYGLTTSAALSSAQYAYKVFFSVTKTPVVTEYDALYNTYYYFEEDFNNDGVSDYNSTHFNNPTIYSAGRYNTMDQALTALNALSLPALSKYETSFSDSSNDSFLSTKPYSDAKGYRGNLSKSGSSFVTSGSYTAGHSKTAEALCVNNIPGKYGADGIWFSTGAETNPCGTSKSYSSEGYSGTLYRDESTLRTVKACENPGTAGWICTKEFSVNFKGTVTRPAVDSRLFRQNYSGTVTIPKLGQFRPGEWYSSDLGYTRQVDTFDRKYVATIDHIDNSMKTTYPMWNGNYYSTLDEANSVRDLINSSGGAFIQYVEENGQRYRLTLYENPSAITSYELIPGTEMYSYYNDTKLSTSERLFPIGKGWSWDLPYMTTESGKQYIHLQGEGTYEVSGTSLKGYEWNDLSIQTDTTVVVNNERSAYRLSNVQGTKNQYFTSDGRLIRISDSYNNFVDFMYTTNSTYNRQLISQIINNIGNTINISYTNSQVTVSYNNQNTIYHKTTSEGMELLSSVTDVSGRLTSYQYEIKDASFNLMANISSRALKNPYALLSGLVHPTGAVSEFKYELAPINRYIGSNSVNQYYRLVSRQDRIEYENNHTSIYNRIVYSYGQNDIGQSYSNDLTISNEVLVDNVYKVYTYQKDYIDQNNGSKFYLTKQKDKVGTHEKVMAYQYNKKDDYGNPLSFVDNKGNTTTYTYVPNKGLIKSITAPAINNEYLYTEYTYNDKGTVTQEVLKKNNAAGQVIKQMDSQNIKSNGNIGQVIVADTDHTLTYDLSYSENGFLTGIVTSASDIEPINTSYTYDAITGNLLSYIDGNRNGYSYNYDNLGRLIKINMPDGHTASANYNDVTNEVTIINEIGQKTMTRWNGLGWKIEEGLFTPQGYRQLASYNYTPYGQLSSSKDNLGLQTIYDYDEWNRLIEEVNPNGVAYLTEYNDAIREVTTKTRSSNNTIHDGITARYDKFGRVIDLIERDYVNNTSKLVEHNSYDSVHDLLILKMDANQNETQYSYDILGNLIEVVDALDSSMHYNYNNSSLLTKVTYPNDTFTSKTYDSLGRMVSSTDQTGNTRTFQYDKVGNMISQTDNKGQLFTYSYDRRNRLTHKNGPSDAISYTYNEVGQRLTLSDSTGVTSYSYDKDTGLLMSVTSPDGKILRHEYNNAMERKSSTLPFGDRVTYAYDSIGRISNLTWNDENAENYTYDEFGMLSLRTQANSMETIYTRKQGVLTELQHVVHDGYQISLYQYGYDDNKNITRILKPDREELSSKTNIYTYDELNRIKTSTEFDETYSYDTQHNRILVSSNKPFSAVDVQYEYDEWDRLIKVVRDGKIIEYAYNGDNLLVERTENGILTRYYYDGQHIVAEGIVSTNGNVSEKASYLVSDQIVLREDQNETLSYYTYNGHGDVDSLRDDEGYLHNLYEYDMWGNIYNSVETVDNLFTYSGEYWDEVAELQYLRARWYDPSMGRFITKDTYEGDISNPLSLNLYTYVHNNPLIYTDPTGHCPFNNEYWGCIKEVSKYAGEILWDDIKDTGDAIWSFTEAALEYAGPGTGVKTGITYGINNGKAVWIAAKDGFKRVADSVGKILKGTGNLKPQNLLDELANSGVKYNHNDVVAVARNADGKLIWLENGNSQAGLNHILSHVDDFAAKGISQSQLPEFIIKAASQGEIVGYQGKGTGRPIYEIIYNGQTQRAAITTGSNGYIVGANPVSIK